MRIRFGFAVGAIALAVLCGSGASRAEQTPAVLPPLPHKLLKKFANDPAAWQRFLSRQVARHALPALAPPGGQQAPSAVAPGWQTPWTSAALSNPVLLTDGTVMAHVACSGTWWRLTPDNTGSYVNGTWAATAPMPAGYAPQYFSSAVLPDGRLIVEGGEYDQGCNSVWSTNGAIYDPQTDSWTTVAPPAGWTAIGDASGIVLADGRYMLSNSNTTQTAILDPVSLTWTPAGTGKSDANDEENWTLLPNGGVLTVDADTSLTSPAPSCSKQSEIFSPVTGAWSNAGGTVRELADCYGALATNEAPTQILTPAGLVYAFGATISAANRNRPVYTAAYNTKTQQWRGGPAMPQVGGVYHTMADAPAAVLANGMVLIATSPSNWASNDDFPPPTHFFIFDGNTFTQVGDLPDSPSLASYEMNFLVLPTGDILATETDFNNTSIFPALCCARRSWVPTITAISDRKLTAGATYSLIGTQLSGLTQGAVYGDDVQADTNFPLVRIVNDATGHVFYARTSGFGRSVAPGAVSSTGFTVPAGIETGDSKLFVVANGLASIGHQVTILPP